MKITREIKFFIDSLYKATINFAFPQTCPNCDTQIDECQLFCEKCFHQISFIKPPFCYRCGLPLNSDGYHPNDKILCPNCLKKRPTYDLARAVFIYDSFSKTSILKLKYADKMEYAYPFIELMRQAGKELFEKTDIIMPVPMHWKRQLKRKYNQADLLGRTLSKKIKIPYMAKVLIRSRHTETQENKSFEERNHNVKDAFQVRNPLAIKNKRILLIDDVFTTGATVNNCAKALKKSGAKAVYVLTIAKAIKR